MIRLVFGNEKFWDARVDGSTLRLQFGKPGKPGQIRLKDFATPAAAKAAMMDASEEKRAEGFVDAEGAKATKPGAKAKPTRAKAAKAAKPSKRRDALLALAETLGAGPKGVADVALAFDDPEAYAERYEERVEDRSLETDDDEFAWIALVDALLARKQLADLDWKHEGDDALRWISGLAGPAGKRALAPILADKDGTLDERATDEVLELAGATLEPLGLAVLHLEINGDCFEIIVAPRAEVSRLVALARAAGGTITRFSGAKLRALEKERTRAAAKAVAKESSGNKWTKLLTEHRKKTTHDMLGELRQSTDHLDCIREAMAAAPARDRTVVELAVALNDGPAPAIARACADPLVCLRALDYLGEHRKGQAFERLSAAAIGARRLKLTPGTGKEHARLAEACCLSSDEKEIAAALAKLRPADRTLLARLADGLLEGARHGTERWSTACRALRCVGDATSLEAIARNRPRSGEWKEDINDIIDDEYVSYIRRRLKLPKLAKRIVPPRRDGKRLVR